jgi:mRNA-degrading endonuclease toxin of MazEF toxin-antitoxin module
LSYEAQVADALSAAVARPPGAYRWFGRRYETLAPAVALRDRLLADFYEPGAARPARVETTLSGDGGALLAALSQANCGRGSWQQGWNVDAAGGDAIAVTRPDGLTLYAPPQDVRGDEVRVPKELRGLRPGSYVALGDAAGPRGPLLRLSWNVAAAGAATLVARITYALNAAGLAFELELPADPARYGQRCDAASLLLARADFTPATKLLRPLTRTLGAQLRDGAPPLTLALARGLAVAEEPGGGERFGEHRCRLLAEAIFSAGERGLRDAAGRLAAVQERFAADGLTLQAPYLQPGSIDAYASA